MYRINKLVEYDADNKTLVNHISGRLIQLQLSSERARIK